MKTMLATLAALTFLAAGAASAQDAKMSFFITSVGSGDGANLGGLEGADQHCHDLAYAAGFGDLTWHAYLSAPAMDGKPAVNARDRIGSGPWYNYKGVMIARDVTDLHSENNNLTKETQLTEKGQIVNGRTDSPNTHDMLTGSDLDGTLYVGPDPTLCSRWTSDGEGSVRLGHHDRQGGGDNPTSWNSAHDSRGCSQQNLVSTGGAGLYYCFAVEGGGGGGAALQAGRDD